MSLLILLLNTFDYIMGKQFVIYIGNILFIVKVNLCFFGNVATLLRIVFRMIFWYVSLSIMKRLSPHLRNYKNKTGQETNITRANCRVCNDWFLICSNI
jgi:predicted membrane protein